ncbi:M48 family metallopeptidase [Caminicella sporogenes]|uniref:M48 family metallopeptidase n=1 Tax=Caminicella sporogenes TaxID=166485 RepID=UPI0025424FFF|nr:SprT family zinc-dependent metalloprotease [Caminicella sporogenes]WIF94092.1 SprT family zinc-dependent metalloprotease [Caminicella sporogenes]
MRLSFNYGSKNIEFDVIFRKRKTMEISIEPPDIIKVVVPLNTPKEIIIQKVKSKASWIVQKLFEFKDIEYRKIKREFVNGESFMYLGRNYTLQIILDENVKKPEVKLYQGRFYITSFTKEEKVLQKAMEEWYRKKALEKILERIKYYQPYFPVKPKNVKVKEQKKRWGSCSSDRNLLFNWRCVMAPSNVLDYIVVHEMCHMVHMNHSKQFWNLLESIMPDYKKRREWLKNYGIRMDL